MLALFPLLSELRHFLNGNILALQAIPFQVNLVYEIENTIIAILQVRQGLNTPILNRAFLKTLNSHIGTEKRSRVALQNLLTILDSRQCFS